MGTPLLYTPGILESGIGFAIWFVFIICFVAALLLTLKSSGYLRVLGLALAWVLALVPLSLWDGGGSLSLFIFVSPLLFLLYKAVSRLFKWGK